MMMLDLGSGTLFRSLGELFGNRLIGKSPVFDTVLYGFDSCFPNQLQILIFLFERSRHYRKGTECLGAYLLAHDGK